MIPLQNINRRTAAGHALRVGTLSLCVAAALAARPALAGYHERGNITTSLGGSLAYSANYNRKSEDAYDYVYRNGQFYQEPKNGENYSDVDLSIFLSGGYFVKDHLELGISASTLNTSYSSTNRDDFTILDGLLYVKYYFDNKSSVTPYLKAQGGMSRIDTGDYGETDTTFGGLGGVEFLGMGAVTWYAELSSLYTVYGGDISGSRWRNQIYLGLTWYVNLRQKKAPAAGASLPPEALAIQPPAAVSPDVLDQFEKAEKRWKKALDRADRAAGGTERKPASP